MNYSTKTYITRDNLEIFYYHWESPLKQPKGVVQIAHGMGEHAGRYKHIASVLQNPTVQTCRLSCLSGFSRIFILRRNSVFFGAD